MKEEVVCISESKHSKKMLRDSGDKKKSLLQQAFACNCCIVCITVLPANGILSCYYLLLISLLIILIVQISILLLYYSLQIHSSLINNFLST